MDEQMCLEYIRLLRDDPAATHATPWIVDWRRAPCPSKRYEGGARWPLAGPFGIGADGLHRIFSGSVAYRSVHRAAPSGGVARAVRAVASGGALHPSELYLLADDGRLFYYDPIEHALIELNGAPDLPLRLWQSLGFKDDQPAFDLALVETIVLERSYFKYADFSYLLSAADAGVVLGRIHRLARFELGETMIHFDFDDQGVNAILGVDGNQESAYAVVLAGRLHGGSPRLPPPTQGYAGRPLPDVSAVTRSESFDALHRSIVSPRTPTHVPKRPVVWGEPTSDPAAADALRAAISHRRSLGHCFSGQTIDAGLLTAIIKDVDAWLDDFVSASADTDLPALYLYLTIFHVIGVPAGRYRYDRAAGTLACIEEGRYDTILQAAQRSANINVGQAAFVVHCVSPRNLSGSARMNRGYRIQQMIAGAAMDFIALASCARGLVAHPVLGFRSSAIDELYGLAASAYGSIAQVCVGRVRRGMAIDCPIAF